MNRMLFSRILVCAVSLLALVCVGAETPYKAESGSKAETRRNVQWAIEPDTALPNVLILGDSISIGYTIPVREQLSGKANVFRPNKANGKKPENCQGTQFGVKGIDRWLVGRQWDVIHFNWGLHDLKHWKVSEQKNSNDYADPRQSEPEVYRQHLTEIVEKLKATGAKLIFATTTPYPAGVEPARLPADAALYNTIAWEVMQANGIEVNDLYVLVNGQLEALQLPQNVHFNDQGSKVLADQVAAVIEAALPK